MRLPAGHRPGAESEGLSVLASRSQPAVEIVSVRSRGINQRGEVVIEYPRTFVVPRRDSTDVAASFPATDAPLGLGEPEAAPGASA
jgi:hypothetical protein